MVAIGAGSCHTRRMTSPARLAKAEARIAIAGNILLAAYKFIIAYLTGSAAVLADSWHTLSDSLSSLVLLVGVRVAERPPDQTHPFGHGRAELVATLVIGTMLGVLGLEFLTQGIGKLFHPEVTRYGSMALVAMAVTVAVKEAMAQFAFWVARRTGFCSVEADGQHHRSDALSSLVLLVGIAVGRRFAWTDGILTLIVSLFIFQSAWEVLGRAASQILGERPPDELLERLQTLGQECFGPDTYLHHVHVHIYGAHREVTFHATLPPATLLSDAHARASNLEGRIKAELGYDATIHVEPHGDDQ